MSPSAFGPMWAMVQSARLKKRSAVARTPNIKANRKLGLGPVGRADVATAPGRTRTDSTWTPTTQTRAVSLFMPPPEGALKSTNHPNVQVRVTFISYDLCLSISYMKCQGNASFSTPRDESTSFQTPTYMTSPRHKQRLFK